MASLPDDANLRVASLSWLIFDDFAYAGSMAKGDEGEWITLAILKRPQGRKGELLAELLTDFPERFDDRPRVFLARPGFTGPQTEARAMTVKGFWLPVGRNQGRVVLEFEGVETISAAELLGGLEVVVPVEERVPIDDDAAYVSDLIGCSVYALEGDERRLLGTVEAVDFPTTADGTRRLDQGAPLLTVVSASGEEILIPYVNNFLAALLIESKIIEMRLPAGLLELNQAERVDAPKDEPDPGDGNRFVN